MGGVEAVGMPGRRAWRTGELLAEEATVTVTVAIGDEHGLHARPAARFVQAAARYRSAVQMSNLTSGRGPAPARSIIAVLGLGARKGDRVLLRAEGEDASAAVAGLASLLRGEGDGA